MHTHMYQLEKNVYRYTTVRPAGGDNRNERKHVPGTLAAYIYYIFIKIIHFPPAYLYIYTSYKYACLRRRWWGCWEGPEGNGTWTNIRHSSKGRPASSVLYICVHVYIRTLYIYIYLDSSRPSTDSFEGRILCRSFWNTVYNIIHVYDIIVYVSARDGHVLRRFGNNDNIRPVAWFNICGFKNNAEKVIMIHNIVGVRAERNKSILAIYRRNNIISCIVI